MNNSVRVEKPRCIVEGFPRTALLEASAGTGKTYVIERLVVEMLLVHGVRIEEVLVVTFTRKAAAEMAGRIRQCIHDLLHKPEPFFGPGPAWVIDEAARERLSIALANFDQAAISTIHSFCQRVLDEQVLLSGVLKEPAPARVDDLLHDAFASHLRKVAASASEAREVLQHWAILYGDLKELEKLVSDACRSVVDQKNPLSRFRPRIDVSRLQQARAKLLTAFEGPVPSSAAEVEADGILKKASSGESGVANAAFRVFQSIKALADDEKASALSSRAFQLRFLETLKPLMKGTPPAAFMTPDFVQGRSGVLLTAIRALFEAAPTVESVAVDVFLEPVHRAFESLCRQRGASDFQRLLLDTVEAVRGDETGSLATRLRGRFKAVLVDEFQDTDEIQWEILRKVFVDAPSTSRFIAVGDPKQAIYGFRGGDFQTYVSAREVLRACVAQPESLRLSENRRSTKAMVDAYNRLLLTKVKARKARASDPLEPFFGAEAHGIVYDDSSKVSSAGNPGQLLESPGGEPLRPLGLLRVHGMKTGHARVLLRGAVVREAQRLVSGQARLEIPTKDGLVVRAVAPSDLMVLVSTNREAREYVEALADAGILAEQYRAEGLMQSPEAEEIADLLEALAEPGRPDALARAMRTLFFDVPFDELEQLPSLASNDPRLLRWRKWVRLAAQRCWVELFSDMRLGTQLNRRLSFTSEQEKRLGTVHAVLDVLHRVARDGCADIHALARRTRSLLAEDADLPSEDDNIHPSTDSANAARVLTVFKAKGLEAPIVFLATAPRRDPLPEDLKVFHDGPPPERVLWTGSTKGLEKVAAAVDLESDLEDRRFQYVALTRARYRLWLPELTADPTDSDLKKGITGIRPHPDAGSKYRAINQRLFKLRDDADFQALCEVRDHPLGVAEELPLGEVPSDLKPPVAAATVDAEPVRLVARGLQLGSYSSLRKLVFSEPAPEKPPVKRADADSMPNGASAGTILHALIERIPLSSVVVGQSFDAWSARPEVTTLLDEWWRESRWLEAPRRDTERMVHAGLHHPIKNNGLSLPPLGTLREALHREVEFHLPWPSSAQPFGTDGETRWRIERGLLKGSMDFAFEHEGRVFFGDWKSNSLESYDLKTVERSVRASYEVQLRIYTLALCRLYRWTDETTYAKAFGGALYVYLRGFDASGQGLAHLRPTWKQLVELDEQLRSDTLALHAREPMQRLDLVPVKEDESDEDFSGEAA